jgi:hypothetical protein
MKYNSTTYTNKNEILKFSDHFVAIPVMVDDAGITANADGKKIVKAGTIIGGTGGVNSIFNNVATIATEHNTQAGATGSAGAGTDAEGVLLNDVDVTNGDAPGSMLIHGFVDLNKITTAPVADALAVLKTRITFLK